MKRVILAAAVAALLVVPSAAIADRDASPDERAAILGGVGIKPSLEYCFAAKVSVVDGDWAAVFSATPRPTGCDVVGDSLILAHRDRTGAWSDAYSGSAEFPSCPTLGLPTPVGVDLEVCAAPIPVSKTTMTCFSSRGKPLVVRQPRTCRLSAKGGGALRLTNLRWSNWGKTSARATGRTQIGRVSIRMRKRVDWSTNRFYSKAYVSGGGWGRGNVVLGDPSGGYDY